MRTSVVVLFVGPHESKNSHLHVIEFRQLHGLQLREHSGLLANGDVQERLHPLSQLLSELFLHTEHRLWGTHDRRTSSLPLYAAACLSVLLPCDSLRAAVYAMRTDHVSQHANH